MAMTSKRRRRASGWNTKTRDLQVRGAANWRDSATVVHTPPSRPVITCLLHDSRVKTAQCSKRDTPRRQVGVRNDAHRATVPRLCVTMRTHSIRGHRKHKCLRSLIQRARGKATPHCSTGAHRAFKRLTTSKVEFREVRRLPMKQGRQ